MNPTSSSRYFVRILAGFSGVLLLISSFSVNFSSFREARAQDASEAEQETRQKPEADGFDQLTTSAVSVEQVQKDEETASTDTVASLLNDLHASVSTIRDDLVRRGLPETILGRLDEFERRQEAKIRETAEALGANASVDSTSSPQAEEIRTALAANPHPAERITNPHPFRTKAFDGDVPTAPASAFDRTYTRSDASFAERLKGVFLRRDTSGEQEHDRLPQSSGTPVSPDGPAPGPEFTAPTEEIQFTQAIIGKAVELNHDPLKILNFVRNEIEFIPYYGVKKGAHATLIEREGNAFDQSALLQALLRVGDGQGNSQIPTRYREATIKLDPNTVMDWLGVSDPDVASRVLAQTGMPYIAYVDQANNILFFTVEHVFVDAYIDYGYSRGLIQTPGSANKEWIPLDPSLTRTFVSQSINILEEMAQANAWNVTAFYESYLNGAYGTSTPIQALKAQVQTYLAAHHPNLTFEDVLVQLYRQDEKLEFIPRTLPYEIVQELGTWSAAPDNRKHRLTFLVENRARTQTFLSHTAHLTSIADKELVTTYQAATPADQAIINSFGTIYNVAPLSLVNLKPVLKVAGQVIAGGGAADPAVSAGVTQVFKLTFTVPKKDPRTGELTMTDVEVIENDVIAGNALGIAVNTGRIITPEGYPQPDTRSTEFVQSQKLYRTAVNYLDRLENSQHELAELIGGTMSHEATRTYVFNGINVVYQGNEPYSFTWKGLRIDSSSSVIYFNRVSDNAARQMTDFTYVFGLQGSLDESAIFEEDYDIEAMSTVKGLRLVNLGAIPGVSVVKITTANEPVIETLNLSAALKTRFHELVQAGNTLYTPTTAFTYMTWTGLVYIYLDPATGSAGYIIGEGLNGGYTVEAWPSGFQEWWRRLNLLIGGTATIITPQNGQIFTRGNPIPWRARYDGLFGSWDELRAIPSDEFDTGPLTLRTGYGTNVSVTVTIAPPPNPLNINESLKFVNCNTNCTYGRQYGTSPQEIEMIVLHYTVSGPGPNSAVNTWRNNGLSAHYIVDRNGMIYRIVDDKDTARHAGIGYDLSRDAIIKPNQRSIGIEIVNWGWLTAQNGQYFTSPLGNPPTPKPYPGLYTDVVTVTPPWAPHSTLTAYSYWQTFTDAQYSSLRALINSLSVQYGITRIAYSPSPILYEPNANTLANFIGLLGHSVLSGIIGGGKWDPGPVLNWNSILGN